MRRPAAVFSFIALLIPRALAHAGHTGEEVAADGVMVDAIVTVALNEIGIVRLFTVVTALILIGFVGYDMWTREIWELPRHVAALLILVTVALSASLFIQTGDRRPAVHETFGPGMGPMHMEDFYTSLNVRNVKRLQEFRNLPTVEDITHPPGRLPDRITRNHSTTVNITLKAKEVVAEVANGSYYYYWTFNGTVPGPFLRVREGDRVRLTLINSASSTHNHSLDLHAVTGPGGGAGVMGEVPPGGSRTITFTASQEGTYVYHCATDNIPTHIAQGMYGGIVVEPKEGLPPVDEEFVLFQGEIYTKSGIGQDGFQQFSPRKMLSEEPTYYTFNGRVHGITGDDQMKVPAGDSVRLFVGNMGNSKTMAFHVIGEILDRVYRGSFAGPDVRNAETAVIGPGQAVMARLTAERGGTYVPVDHALARLDKGAWGLLNVTGEGNVSMLQRVRN